MTFHKRLFGQHLVTDIVSKAIHHHVFNDSPEKALVLSFHGSTGTGKNYVSDIITNHLYFMGSRSKFVVKRLSGQDYPHASEIDKYEKELKRLIKEQTSICERSLFIFDEMDKMPEGLINTLKPYLDYYPDVHGVDYRKNIFIFLSNLGAEEINNETYNYLNSGKKRESIAKVQMEKVLQNAVSKQTGGFKGTVLIESGLIDFFVPFLPLEKEHIKQCVEESINERQKNKPVNQRKPATDELKEVIAAELQYFAKFDEKFAENGCKKVMKKASLHIQKF